MRRKVCMLGAFAVGKTSLVARSVKGIFSDKYLTTVGVKIDRKTGRATFTRVRTVVEDEELEKLRLEADTEAAASEDVAGLTREVIAAALDGPAPGRISAATGSARWRMRTCARNSPSGSR